MFCRDTITTLENESHEQLPGIESNLWFIVDYIQLIILSIKIYEEALEKIQLSDSSLVFEPETSRIRTFGFRCGFVLLHMDVIQERLEREFDLGTYCYCTICYLYKYFLTDKTMVEIDNPAMMPSPQVINYIEEPYVKLQL